jgi:hypothetical protein
MRSHICLYIGYGLQTLGLIARGYDDIGSLISDELGSLKADSFATSRNEHRFAHLIFLRMNGVHVRRHEARNGLSHH